MTRTAAAGYYLAVGQWVSYVGDLAFSVALAIWIRDQTGLASAAGLLMTTAAVGGLIAPLLSGDLGRLGWRHTLIITDLLCAVFLGSLIWGHGSVRVVLAMLLAFLLGIAAVLIASAQAIGIVTLVEDERLPRWNSIIQTGQEGLRLVAPLIGALIYGVHANIREVAIVDAATFVVSASLVLPIKSSNTKPDVGAEPAEEKSSTGRARLIADGIRAMWSHSTMRTALSTAIIAITAIGLLQPALFALLATSLHSTTRLIAIFVSSQAVGAIIGGLSAATAVRKLGTGHAASLSTIGTGISILLFLVPVLAVDCCAAAAAGFFLSIIVVAFVTALQRGATDQTAASVMTSAEAAAAVAQPIGLGAGTVALAATVPWQGLVVAAGAVGIVAGTMELLRSRSIQSDLFAEPAGVGEG
jgi:MFS family permease